MHLQSSLNPMLLVANLATKWRKNPEFFLKPWHMGTHLKVLCKTFSINTNMTGFKCFSKTFASLCFGWKLASALEGLNITESNHKPNFRLYHSPNKTNCFNTSKQNLSHTRHFDYILTFCIQKHNKTVRKISWSPWSIILFFTTEEWDIAII